MIFWKSLYTLRSFQKLPRFKRIPVRHVVTSFSFSIVMFFFTCKVLSGDSVVIRGQPRGGPPPERQLCLSNVNAPKLARRSNPNVEGSVETRDEVSFVCLCNVTLLHCTEMHIVSGITSHFLKNDCSFKDIRENFERQLLSKLICLLIVWDIHFVINCSESVVVIGQ